MPDFYFCVNDYGYIIAITLALLTKTYKTTDSDTPLVHKAIDLFSTHYDGSTIKIEKKSHSLSASESYNTVHHSYNGKTLNIPSGIENSKDNTVVPIDGIRYCGKYINLEDYCKFFSLDVSLKVEFDAELSRNILVVDYL